MALHKTNLDTLRVIAKKHREQSEALRISGEHPAQGLAIGAAALSIEDAIAEIEGLRAAVAAECERCAEIAENWRSPYGGPRDGEVAEAIAEEIRKGG
jgi:hypothetical protein